LLRHLFEIGEEPECEIIEKDSVGRGGFDCKNERRRCVCMNAIAAVVRHYNCPYQDGWAGACREYYSLILPA